MSAHCAPISPGSPSYFVVMIDYPACYEHGIRVRAAAREAVVDPEVTRRRIVDNIRTGQYGQIAFIHEVSDWRVVDVTEELTSKARCDAILSDIAEVMSAADRRAACFDHARDLRKHEAV